ncbi:MAG: recombinase family protein, partial [Candidatus Entotheonellia bacterium]
PMGKAMFTVISAIAECERALISERVRAGATRVRGAMCDNRWPVPASPRAIAPGTRRTISRRGVPLGPYTTPALDTAGEAAPVVGAGDAHDHGHPEHAAHHSRPRETRPQLSSQRERGGTGSAAQRAPTREEEQGTQEDTHEEERLPEGRQHRDRRDREDGPSGRAAKIPG